jgi:hypothetical protein
MPSTPQITLDVRNFATTATNWTNVTASNGQTYSYSYTGGDDGTGGLVMTVGQGRDTAPVRIVADQRYDITNCTFTGDGASQLTWNGNSTKAGSIVDANTAVENAEYTLLITDTVANCTVACDPPVRNVPT